jgi:hypothetical protein
LFNPYRHSYLEPSCSTIAVLFLPLVGFILERLSNASN